MWKILLKVLYMHPASLGVIWYRVGRAAWQCRVPVVKQIGLLFYLLLLPVVRIYSGVHLLPPTEVGPGLAILHFGGVLISSGTRIGKNCLLTHNVNIAAERSSRAATIGDNFFAGVGSVLIGPLIIEDNVTVGAGTILTKSVPKDAIVAGVPARIIRFRKPGEQPSENKTLPPSDPGWLTPESPVSKARTNS